MPQRQPTATVKKGKPGHRSPSLAVYLYEPSVALSPRRAQKRAHRSGYPEPRRSLVQMRSMMMLAAVVLSTVFAVAPAMADDKGHEKVRSPRPAAAFKQKVDSRQAKAREHMEKRAATLTAEQAKELRAKF